MELQRLAHYEPGTKLIALFPVSAYKSTSKDTVSKRATKMSPGEVVTVHGDGPEWADDGGFAIQWKGGHYRVYVRYDFAVAPEPNQVAWLMVDHNIAKGQIDRLQAKADDLTTDLLKSRQRVAILEEALDEANDEVGRQKNRADANAQIMAGEQHSLHSALNHIERIWAVIEEADEEFNFSLRHDPDDSPR